MSKQSVIHGRAHPQNQTVNELLAMSYYHPSIEELLQSALKSAASRLRF
ncbi:hypothetical protein ACSBPU_06520 [Parapusillimonas sp. JC17]